MIGAHEKSPKSAVQLHEQQIRKEIVNGLKRINASSDFDFRASVNSLYDYLQSLTTSDAETAKLLVTHKNFCDGLLKDISDIQNYALNLEEADAKKYKSNCLGGMKVLIQRYIESLEVKPKAPIAPLHTMDGRKVALSRHQNGTLAFHFESQEIRNVFIKRLIELDPKMKDQFLLLSSQPNLFCLEDMVDYSMDYKRGQVYYSELAFTSKAAADEFYRLFFAQASGVCVFANMMSISHDDYPQISKDKKDQSSRVEFPLTVALSNLVIVSAALTLTPITRIKQSASPTALASALAFREAYHATVVSAPQDLYRNRRMKPAAAGLPKLNHVLSAPRNEKEAVEERITAERKTRFKPI